MGATPIDGRLVRRAGAACRRLVVTGLLLAALAWAGTARSADGPVAVFDGAGKTVRLGCPAKRIVVVGRAPFIPLHMLYMFPETRKRMVGYEKRGSGKERFLPLVDPDCRRKTVLGANPGPEQIAALHPDLVVTKNTVRGSLDTSMAALGIPVLNLGVENPKQFLADIENLGRVLGNPTRAAAIVAYYRTQLDRIDAGLRGVTHQQRPRVLTMSYNQRAGKAAMRVPAARWIQTLQSRMAGGAPVWLDRFQVHNGWQIVDFEQIAAWDPDRIFLIVWYRLDGCRVLESLTTDARWQKLAAVSSGAIHLFPTDIYGWDSPDPRWILGLLWMAARTHPDRFADIDIRTEVIHFFHCLYGLDHQTIVSRILPEVITDGCP